VRFQLIDVLQIWSESISTEEKLSSLALKDVTLLNTYRAYAIGLEQFFKWLRIQAPQPCSESTVAWVSTLALEQNLSPATINLRLTPLRKLAREMGDNGLSDSDTAAAMERITGAKHQGVRAGKWLRKGQATDLLNAPDPSTLKGKRDRARCSAHRWYIVDVY
jgi:integrase/recombinase XerD